MTQQVKSIIFYFQFSTLEDEKALRPHVHISHTITKFGFQFSKDQSELRTLNVSN